MGDVKLLGETCLDLFGLQMSDSGKETDENVGRVPFVSRSPLGGPQNLVPSTGEDMVGAHPALTPESRGGTWEEGHPGRWVAQLRAGSQARTALCYDLRGMIAQPAPRGWCAWHTRGRLQGNPDSIATPTKATWGGCLIHLIMEVWTI